MKKDYTGKYTNPISSYCYNCYAYGHRASECRRPRFNSNMCQRTNPAASRPIGATNVIRNGIMCHKCNKFGHIARDCRLKLSELGPSYGNNVIVSQICNNMGHTTRFCRMNNMRNDMIP